MEKLPPPILRHTSGAFPSHSSTMDLHKNFKNMDMNALGFIMVKLEYFERVENNFKPTKKAVADGLIDACEKKALWKLDKVAEILSEQGNEVERSPVNQELKAPKSLEPKWVNLGTIGTYFNVTANQIGKWLTELGYKDNSGEITEEAKEFGLATESEMNAGGKKTRKIIMWDLYPTQKVLVDAGHLLDFDYEKTLKGTGKNSDVSVISFDDKAKEFAEKFVELYKDKKRRPEIKSLVRRTPKPIQDKAEVLLKKPGLFSKEKYLHLIN